MSAMGGYWVMGKDATEYPTMHKTVTQNKVLQDRSQQPLSSNY